MEPDTWPEPWPGCPPKPSSGSLRVRSGGPSCAQPHCSTQGLDAPLPRIVETLAQANRPEPLPIPSDLSARFPECSYDLPLLLPLAHPARRRRRVDVRRLTENSAYVRSTGEPSTALRPRREDRHRRGRQHLLPHFRFVRSLCTVMRQLERRSQAFIGCRHARQRASLSAGPGRRSAKPAAWTRLRRSHGRSPT